MQVTPPPFLPLSYSLSVSLTHLYTHKEWMPYLGNITLSRYAFELTEVFTHERITRIYPGHQMHLFGHSPDAVRIPFLRKGLDHDIHISFFPLNLDT